MPDVGVLPSLPGLTWSVNKTPIFQTRIQRSISGRELRALDYPYPLWQFELNFNFMRDGHDLRGQGLGIGLNELRTIMGFYALCQGAFNTFLFSDPTDNSVLGQTLPPAASVLASVPSIVAAGTGYSTGESVGLLGGNGTAAVLTVASVNGTGGITGLGIIYPGSYATIPGTSGVAITSPSGSGATVNAAWRTQTQLVRTLGDPSIPGGGFVERMVAPNVTSAIYFDGIPQTGWSVDPATGIVTLANPFPTPSYGFTGPVVVANGGTNYRQQELLSPVGGTLYPYGGRVAIFNVNTTTVSPSYGLGVILTMSVRDSGSYSVPPSGTVGTIDLSGGIGTGATLTLTPSIVRLQPTITADFTYYFRCRFVEDKYMFENFMLQLWQLKKLTFISVR